jgi:ribonuclease HII
VLREVQVLTITATLARLDYRTADAARAAIANLIASLTTPRPAQDVDTRTAPQVNGHPASSVLTDVSDGDHDAELVAAASRIVARATQDGDRLSQVALGRELRNQGFTIANNRLRWLSCASGLTPRHNAEPNGQPRRER